MALLVSEQWKKKYQIDEELKDYARLIAIGSIKITSAKIALSNTALTIMNQAPMIDLRIKKSKKRIHTYDGKTIGVTIYEPKNLNSEKAPAILYLHGGGFMIKEAALHHKVSCDYAYGAKAKVFFVHYRLAPKYSFPYPAEDCYSALLWLYRNATRLGVDKKRIAVAGDSAGGCLAAALTHMSRDRSGPPICFQMLIYPALDHRQKTSSIKMFFDARAGILCSTNKCGKYIFVMDTSACCHMLRRPYLKILKVCRRRISNPKNLIAFVTKPSNMLKNLPNMVLLSKLTFLKEPFMPLTYCNIKR